MYLLEWKYVFAACMKRTGLVRKTPLKAKAPLKARKRPQERRAAPKATKTDRRPKPRSKAQLRKELDTLFSRFIRYSAVEKDGLVSCYTCPHRGEPKKMQNGHFVPRQYLATRYDEVNNHPQCYACNQLYNGQPSVYATRLEREYGAGTVAMLESKRSQIVPDFPYGYWIEVYREKLEQLGISQ